MTDPTTRRLLALAVLAFASTQAARADLFLGAMIDRSNGGTGVSAQAGAGGIVAPDRPDPNYPLDRSKGDKYGHWQVRLEAGADTVLGSGTGIQADIVAGKELVALKGKALGLHLGVEPLNTHLSANRDDDRTDYIELTPMLSLGAQAAAGSCHILAAARVGSRIGTLGREPVGLGVSYGGGGQVVCKGAKAAGEWTRIVSTDERFDIGSLEIKRYKQGEYAPTFWGVRAEAVRTRQTRGFPEDVEAAAKNEYRVMGTVGIAVF